MDHSPSSSSAESTMPATRPSLPSHSYHVSGSHTSRPSKVEPILPDTSPLPQRPPKPPGDLLIFDNGARRVIVLRPKTYEVSTCLQWLQYDPDPDAKSQDALIAAK